MDKPTNLNNPFSFFKGQQRAQSQNSPIDSKKDMTAGNSELIDIQKYDIFNAPVRTNNDCIMTPPRIPGANDN